MNSSQNFTAKLLTIVGPTSSGKTSLSLKLAKKFNGEIISADSRQIYKEMNIGTNKITDYKTLSRIYNVPEIIKPVHAIEHQEIPHYFVDVCKPDKDFSLYQFKNAAVEIIKDIQSRGKLPIMAGGTGLYINSILDNLQIPEVPADNKLRKKLEDKNNEELYKIFRNLDKSGSKTVDKHNKRRIIRAIEILKNSPNQKPALKSKGPQVFDTLVIGLDLPREVLYERINNWVDSIFGNNPDKSPIIKETKALLKNYKFEDTQTLQGLVYKQIVWYLKGYPSQKEKGQKVSFEEAKEFAKQVTRNYAKRQLTWFRKDERIKWIDANNSFDESVLLINKWNADNAD